MPLSALTRRLRSIVAAAAGTAVVAGLLLGGTAARAQESDVPETYGTNVGQLHVSPSAGSWSDRLTRVWTDTAFGPETDKYPVIWLTLIQGNPVLKSVLAYLPGNRLYTGPLHGSPYNFGSDPAATGGDIIGYSFADGLEDTPINRDAIGSTFAVVLEARTSTGGNTSANQYFRANFEVTATGWKLADAAPAEQTDTTTGLTATALANGAVKLTATVAPATASGSVSFRDGNGAEVGTGAVSGGVATWTSDTLDAGAEYRFTAAYSGDASFKASTSSELTVTTVAEPQAPQDTNLTVTIPASATGLKFTVTPGDVALGGTTLQGTSYVANGQLGDVKISDNRATRTAWSLNGKAGDFTNTADASKKIASSFLGWKPALVGAGGGTAGAEVVAGTSGGLSTDKPLAQAPAGATVADTTVNAGVTLRAPADSAAGNYKATLTLTLI